MKIRSFAKINLGLEIVRKRADGYHDIRTLFQSISLFDELEFRPATDGRFSLTGSDPSVPWDETNLVHRAADLIRRRSGITEGLAVRVTKNIPAGRGLGGGSGNAAATLMALNQYWSLELALEDLADMGRKLGADVPFFLHGGLCLGEKRGDELTELEDIEPKSCLLGFPPYPIRTASIYDGIPPILTSKGKVSKIMRFLKTDDFGLLENQLETVIFQAHPELEEWKTFFERGGALLSLVSGSGSAVFGLFEDREQAHSALGRIGTRGTARLVDILPREGCRKALDAGV